MNSKTFARAVAVWCAATVLGLTTTLVAVGLLGLWVAAGALVGLGATLACGGLGQLLLATDIDAVLARKAGGASNRDELP